MSSKKTRKEYIKQLHEFVDQDNEPEFEKLCQHLLENNIEYLGYLLEKKEEGENHRVLRYPQKYLDILQNKFFDKKTLRMLFDLYGFPPVIFSHPDLKLKISPEKLEMGNTFFGNGIIPKDRDFRLINEMFEKDYNSPFLYQQILDLDLPLKEFYLEQMPMNFYTSPRYSQRKLAEIFYLELLTINQRPTEEIEYFRKNHQETNEDCDEDNEN